tara:strand:- start:4737 stop:4997 length:261 start_codon:yes stop_codon:yes gene_type:complete
MTPEEIQHKSDNFRDMALAVFQKKAHNKYNKGQQEHKDFLPDRELGILLDMLEEEIVDMVFYMSAIRVSLAKRHRHVGLEDVKTPE